MKCRWLFMCGIYRPLCQLAHQIIWHLKPWHDCSRVQMDRAASVKTVTGGLWASVLMRCSMDELRLRMRVLGLWSSHMQTSWITRYIVQVELKIYIAEVLKVRKLLGNYAITSDTRRCSESAYICQLMADALWEGHTLLKTGLSACTHASENSISTSFTLFTWRI